MKLIRRLVTLGLALIIVVGVEGRASAVAIFNTGDDLFFAGELPEPYNSYPELEGFSAGFHCQVFGLFWAYIVWWDCNPVAIDAARESYYDVPELVEAIANNYDRGDIKTGLWQGKGRWILLASLGLLFFLGIRDRLRGGTSEEDQEEDQEEDLGGEETEASEEEDWSQNR